MANAQPERHRKYLEAIAAGDADRADALVAEARGKQNPTLGALLRLARACEVPLERLLLPDGAPPAPTRATRTRT